MADGKLAVMVPENNTTVARELPLYFGDQATMEITKIPRPKELLTVETLPAYAAKACDLAEGLAGRGFDLVVYACTAASFLQGREGDLALAERVNERSGVPVVTTAQSMAHRLNVLGCHTIGLVSPYSVTVNQSLVKYLNDTGTEVAAIGRLEAPDTAALGRITADEVEACVRATMKASYDGMFIACTQLPTFSFIRDVEAEFGKPIQSAIRATAWMAASKTGLQCAV